ncbi:hypothetical protein T492DRAFT_833373 [Pavlovales sp. CCMP2436]|nr:hypothetical protein T492DRAFT_833373 [Pavlovales sp. CCMP2436]
MPISNMKVSSLRVQIASATDERASLSDRYARMKLRNTSKAGVAREAAALIAELEAHLARERRENVQHARGLNERLYQQEQRQCDLFVEKRLLELKVEALAGQIDERDRIETSIEARIFSLFGRLQQLEDTNLQLELVSIND